MMKKRLILIFSLLALSTAALHALEQEPEQVFPAPVDSTLLGRDMLIK